MKKEGQTTRLDFPVKGMHCAGCVGKVERALLAAPGVQQAVVNLATERATVELASDGPTLADLRRAVAAAGYTVPEEIAATPETEDREQALRRQENRLLQLKFLVGAVLSVPVLVVDGVVVVVLPGAKPHFLPLLLGFGFL